MPKGTPKKYDGAFKLKVVIETYTGAKTLAQIASEYGVHPTQIHKWKTIFKTEGPSIFQKEIDHDKIKLETLNDELYKQIGQLTVERDWLKKKSATFN